MLGTYPEALRSLVLSNGVDHILVDGKMVLPIESITRCRPLVQTWKNRTRISRLTRVTA
jgi:hypothetical protein